MSKLVAWLFALLLLGASGCVKPWERDVLARPDMSWTPDKLEALRRAHIQFSKETALPGGTAGGGGCGCN